MNKPLQIFGFTASRFTSLNNFKIGEMVVQKMEAYNKK
jgi:hypothetical protein